MPTDRSAALAPVALAALAVSAAWALSAAEQAAPAGEAPAAPEKSSDAGKAPISPATGMPKAPKLGKGVDILKTRNFFLSSPPTGPVVVIKVETKTPPPPNDPADKVVVTGILRLGGQWMAVVEQVETRTGHFVGVGEDVPGLTDWRLETVDPENEKARFRNKGAVADVALGANLTGRNTAAIDKILQGGRAMTGGATAGVATAAAAGSTKDGRREKGGKFGPGPSAGGSTAPVFIAPPVGPPAGGGAEADAGERINRKSGVAEEDARFLESYLPERDAKTGRRPGK